MATKVTEEQSAEMRRLRKAGMSIAEVAEKMGINKHTVGYWLGKKKLAQQKYRAKRKTTRRTPHTFTAIETEAVTAPVETERRAVVIITDYRNVGQLLETFR